jgi:hypothetical protein
MSKRVSSVNARLFDVDEPDLVRNRKLLADDFLDERLADMLQWTDDAGLDETFAAFRATESSGSTQHV